AGSDKTGKSFWLQDVAFRGVCQRKRTLYVEAGDMTRRQLARRLFSRIMRRPLKPCKYSYPTELNLVAENGQKRGKVSYKPMAFNDYVTQEQIEAKIQALCEHQAQSFDS